LRTCPDVHKCVRVGTHWHFAQLVAGFECVQARTHPPSRCVRVRTHLSPAPNPMSELGRRDGRCQKAQPRRRNPLAVTSRLSVAPYGLRRSVLTVFPRVRRTGASPRLSRHGQTVGEAPPPDIGVACARVGSPFKAPLTSAAHRRRCVVVRRVIPSGRRTASGVPYGLRS
jgi:hypothetical protein